MAIRWWRGALAGRCHGDGRDGVRAHGAGGPGLHATNAGHWVDDESGRCTAGFAAQGNDGDYYLLTSGHCDAHNGSVWTYGQDVPLGTITASEKEGDKRDGAIIRP